MQLVNIVYAAITAGQRSGKGVEGEGAWGRRPGGIYRYMAWGDWAAREVWACRPSIFRGNMCSVLLRSMGPSTSFDVLQPSY